MEDATGTGSRVTKQRRINCRKRHCSVESTDADFRPVNQRSLPLPVDENSRDVSNKGNPRPEHVKFQQLNTTGG